MRLFQENQTSGSLGFYTKNYGIDPREFEGGWNQTNDGGTAYDLGSDIIYDNFLFVNKNSFDAAVDGDTIAGGLGGDYTDSETGEEGIIFDPSLTANKDGDTYFVKDIVDSFQDAATAVGEFISDCTSKAHIY